MGQTKVDIFPNQRGGGRGAEEKEVDADGVQVVGK